MSRVIANAFDLSPSLNCVFNILISGYFANASLNPASLSIAVVVPGL